ncbi:MAG: response regulator [Magnetococcales bacterium]|nr:response regulator [Magnetococcales bacterium]
MIEILLVDDSATSLMLLKAILESDPTLRVVATARDGLEAIEWVHKKKPDLIVMDINMPKMDGYEATQRILQIYPIPIIICSGAWGSPEAVQSFKAIEVGAVTALSKPEGPGSPDYAATVAYFIRMVKAMAAVRVVRRVRQSPGDTPREEITNLPQLMQRYRKQVDVVVMGASTGGPPVLNEILSGLHRAPPFPIVVVQHITTGFLAGMVTWLSAAVRLPIHIAEHGQLLQPGCVYFGPDQQHIGIQNNRIVLDDKRPPEHGLRPTVANLFHSAADHYGRRAVGILLTGMGADGAKELQTMRVKGALTIAQDQKSALIFGMPGEAIKLGAAQLVLNPGEIIDVLNGLY